MTLLLKRELILSRAKLCLVSVFPDIVKDCPKIRNLPKIFLRSFENVAEGSYRPRKFSAAISTFELKSASMNYHDYADYWVRRWVPGRAFND